MTGDVITKYYYAGTQRIAMRMCTNSTCSAPNYLLSDHLGSTSLTVGAAGNVVSEMRYKAWGEVRFASGPTLTDYTYTGQYSYTSDFGLMYYNARWYDPSLGRFNQPDTIIPEQSQGVQAWDRYAYTNNNPVKYNDPSGHCIPPVLLAICVAAIAVGNFIADNVVAISAITTVGVITSFATSDNPDPVLMNDPVAAQERLNGAVGTALTIGTFGEGTLGFGSFGAPRLPFKNSNSVAGADDIAENGIVAVPKPSSGYGGQFLDPEDEIVIFAAQKGAASFKTFDSLGNSAQSLRVAGSPEEALRATFNRPPAPGEPYWTTTAGQIGATGRYPYLDGQGSPGHVSIFGGAPNTGPVGNTRFDDAIEFLKIWVKGIFE